MKVIYGLIFAVILLIGVIPLADAKKTSPQDRLEEKANALENKINRLLNICENAGITVSYAYCFSKGYDYYKNRLYKYVDDGQRLNLEYKMYFWSKQIKA